MTRYFCSSFFLCAFFSASSWTVTAFTTFNPGFVSNAVKSSLAVGATSKDSVECDQNEATRQSLTSRRSLIFGGLVSALAIAPLELPNQSWVAWAEEGGNIPMVTTQEFLVILADSAKSIQRVEFSGVKSETVRVRLIDGTTFGLSDVVESPTDPRSPLKVQAACREAKVPFKNLQMEAILASAPKKTKMYTNQRVQDAAAKEKVRLERLAKDEEERLAKIFEMEQKEAERAAAAAAAAASSS